MSSLDLREIERSIGADLLRRPIITTVFNAALLKFFWDTVLDIEEDAEYADEDEKGIMQLSWFQPTLAVCIYLLATLLFFVGVAESACWVVVAIISRLPLIPRIYALEKLLLDIRVVLFRRTVRYVDKRMRFHILPKTGWPLQYRRVGFGRLVITIITVTETLTRDTAALLYMVRYINRRTIAFWAEDSLVLVGRNEQIISALCDAECPETVIPLGWHLDIIERTVFRMSAIFTHEVPRRRDSSILAIRRRAIVAEIVVVANTANLELLGRTMGQFAAVCEASERGKRRFNGKRMLIYGIGILLGLWLIVFYEGWEGLLRPSADALTLAVGIFTLWMTIGSSEVLGVTEEKVELAVHSRNNLLLAFHGLARIPGRVVNVCWVPEVFREEREEPDEVEREDGSITMLEAATALSIFDHFGYLLKWKGARLKCDRYLVKRRTGHVSGTMRVRRMKELVCLNVGDPVDKLGCECDTDRSVTQLPLHNL